MDEQAKREWIRKWIAEGLERGWSSKEIAQRARVCPRTIRRWTKRLRAESASLTEPDFDHQAFVDLVERSDSRVARLEVVLPNQGRVVIDGHAIVQALARFLLSDE